MVKSLLTIVTILFCSMQILASTVNRGSLNFSVNPERLRSNVEYGLEFFSYKNRLPTELKIFDVEDFKNGSNELVYSKSAFILNKGIDKINRAEFLNGNSLATVFNAKLLSGNGSSDFYYSMKVVVKRIRFHMNAVVDSEFPADSLVAPYVEASKNFDTELGMTGFYVTQILDQFSEGIKRMVIISKVIPYGEQTLVVNYHLCALDYRWFKRLNIFNAVKKVFKKRILQTLEKTRRTMD